MRYEKGKFAVIPLSDLERVPATAQALFLWICKFADEEGICYPSRNKLATLLNVAVRTVDTHIALLEEAGLIKKTVRQKPGSKENMSNLYQIQIPEVAQIMHHPLAEKDTTPRAENSTVTIPDINYIKPKRKKREPKAPKEELPYFFEEEMQKLRDSHWVVDKIIYLYFMKKGFRFENRKMFNSARARNIRTAKMLEGYNATQIEEAMDYVEENFSQYGWTLETVGKRIDSLINQK